MKQIEKSWVKTCETLETHTEMPAGTHRLNASKAVATSIKFKRTQGRLSATPMLSSLARVKAEAEAVK